MKQDHKQVIRSDSADAAQDGEAGRECARIVRQLSDAELMQAGIRVFSGVSRARLARLRAEAGRERSEARQ